MFKNIWQRYIICFISHSISCESNKYTVVSVTQSTKIHSHSEHVTDSENSTFQLEVSGTVLALHYQSQSLISLLTFLACKYALMPIIFCLLSTKIIRDFL